MKTNRNIAMLTGILFIATEITAIAGLLLYDPILHDATYIVNSAVSETRVLWGAFFEILLVLSVVGTSITLYPVLKKYNETMALGTVCFRLLEATIIIIGIMSLLAIVTLNHEFLGETLPDVQSYLVAGKLLLNVHNWTFLYGPNLILGPSTFLTSYLLYKLKLVPRLITVLGLVGGPLISLNAILVTFGLYPQMSVLAFLFAIPVFAYEVSLALRLLIRGFDLPTAAYIPVLNLFDLSRTSGATKSL